MRIAIPLVAILLLAGCAEEGTDPTPSVSSPAGATPAVTPPATAPTSRPTPEVSTRCDPVLPQLDVDWGPRKPRVRVNTSKGEFIIEVEAERAPVTAQNFLELVRTGFYNGTLFHRVVRDFVIQGGDPLSKDNDPDNDGTGGRTDARGQEINIPDELHPALRHDAVGVLSMANSGPDTGSSQFFVTLNATPHLDDRHSVFGRVVEGINVVRSIGVVQVGQEDRPVEPVQLVGAEEIAPTEYEPQRGAGVHVVIPDKKAEAGRAVRFAVIAKNTGNVRDMFGVGAEPPTGWTCGTPEPVTVPPGTARVVLLAITPPAGATGTMEIPVYVTSSEGATARTTVNVTIAPLGAQVKDGDRVTANYAGLLPDGRLFDTSIERVAKDPAQPKFATIGGFRERPSYATFPFTVGSGVIDGFTNLARTAKVGETVTSFIPAEDAYATGNVYERPLTGRDLIFELEIVRVG